MYILGINAYHGGASACLIKDGHLIAAAEEERFIRIKYWAGFPLKAIQYVLAEAGITVYDLDHIGISRDPNAHLMKKILFTLSKRPSLSLIRSRLQNATQVRDPKEQLAELMGIDKNSLRADIHRVEHHRAHMASAFYVSPFKEAAIFSIDGMGDFVSTMWGTGRDTRLDVADMIHFPHSLGFFYTAISQWLGFPKYGDEGKVMGLAPYGNPIYIDEMRKILRVQQDGTFELNLDYFAVHTEGSTMTFEQGDPVLGKLYSSKLIDLLGEARTPRSEITKHHQNIAASLQTVLEEAEFALINKLHRETGQKALCMAGGVALNSAFNGKILPNTAFEDIFIQPAAGDAGTSLGVCYFIWHEILGHPREFIMTNAYTGPSYSNDIIRQALKEQQLDYEEYDDDELAKLTSVEIAQGNVVGWFQGRMEWGPRALGNRSIVADPRRNDMKDILNARIKHRETFRPFAPSILLEYVGDYFDQTYPDPFMLKVYGVLPEKQSEIPAITHVDGTGRLQTVDQISSPRYWQLINAFKEETGVPIVLNTSFNENEPIVCTPSEAISTFVRTKMDVLAIGNYLVKK